MSQATQEETTITAAEAADYYEQALEEVHTRFVLNVPDSELQTADRIFFQLEQAWWFYEDWIADQHPERNLPRFSNLKPFCQKLFAYSTILPPQDQFTPMWNAFGAYKRKISNYGCILLTQDCRKLILCQLWNSKTHTFPAGKINQGEDGLSAGARETYEETGFDPLCQFGLTALWKKDDESKISWRIRESDYLSYEEQDGGKRRTVFVVKGVPEDFPFEPVARKEVAAVNWHPIDAIPKPSFGVMPFLPQLKRWIKKNNKQNNTAAARNAGSTPTTRDRSNKKSRKKTPKKGGRDDSTGRASVQSDNWVDTGLAAPGEPAGWSADDMFRTNESLTGLKVEYGGNPHEFGGLASDGKADPHAYRIVGGSFLNASGSTPPSSQPTVPLESKLQPLFAKEGEDRELTPFFGADGSAPWERTDGETAHFLPPAASTTTTVAPAVAPAVPAPLQKVAQSSTLDEIFMTDQEITAQSQAIKTSGRSQADKDWDDIMAWVERLPKPVATKHFGPPIQLIVDDELLRD